MTKRILLAIAALAALTLSFSSCKKDNKGDTPKGGDIKIAVDPASYEVMVGKTVTLGIVVDPDGTKYTCESADASIASVDDKGVVTGVKVGETVITVKAGGKTETANVKVIPMVDIKDDMYIGLYNDGTEKYIPAIYMPYKAADLTKDKQNEIVYAMTSKGWTLSPYSDDQNSDVAFRFTSPKDNEDWRMWNFAYYHTPQKGGRFCTGTQGAYKFDPLVAADQLNEDQKQVRTLIETVAKAYGFTDLKNTTVAEQYNGFFGYNLSRGNDNPLELLAFCRPKDIKDNKTGKTETYYFIEFQITWDGPKKEGQSTTNLMARPVLEDNVDLSMLLKRSAKLSLH